MAVGRNPITFTVKTLWLIDNLTGKRSIVSKNNPQLGLVLSTQQQLATQFNIDCFPEGSPSCAFPVLSCLPTSTHYDFASFVEALVKGQIDVAHVTVIAYLDGTHPLNFDDNITLLKYVNNLLAVQKSLVESEPVTYPGSSRQSDPTFWANHDNPHRTMVKEPTLRRKTGKRKPQDAYITKFKILDKTPQELGLPTPKESKGPTKRRQ